MFNKNKKYALYILWFFFNLVLFLTSGNFLTTYDSKFFPFPIIKTKDLTTYHYVIYDRVNDWFNGVPPYEDFILECKKDKNVLRKIWKAADERKYYLGDSTYFYKEMTNSIDEYGFDKTYTKYEFFTGSLNDYDYSEFIIFLMAPLVLFYFNKFWFKIK